MSNFNATDKPSILQRKKLALAKQLMQLINQDRHTDIFMEIQMNEAEECLDFDICSAFMDSAVDMARLLNLTFFQVAKGDRIHYSLLP